MAKNLSGHLVDDDPIMYNGRKKHLMFIQLCTAVRAAESLKAKDVRRLTKNKRFSSSYFYRKIVYCKHSMKYLILKCPNLKKWRLVVRAFWSTAVHCTQSRFTNNWRKYFLFLSLEISKSCCHYEFLVSAFKLNYTVEFVFSILNDFSPSFKQTNCP